MKRSVIKSTNILFPVIDPIITVRLAWAILNDVASSANDIFRKRVRKSYYLVTVEK